MGVKWVEEELARRRRSLFILKIERYKIENWQEERTRQWCKRERERE